MASVSPLADPPPGLIAVPLGKACLLLLTQAEFRAGVKRGKTWRRREALAERVEMPQKDTNT